MCSKFDKLMHTFQDKDLGLTQISLVIIAQGNENFQLMKRSKKWVSFKIIETTRDLDLWGLETDLDSVFKYIYDVLTEDCHDLDIITLSISCDKLFGLDKCNEFHLKPDLKGKNNFSRLKHAIENGSFHCTNDTPIRFEVMITPIPHRPIT